MVDAFSSVAKDLNLTQEAAQKVLDTMAPVLAAQTATRIAALHDVWVQETQTDKEIGGVNLDKNLAVAESALKRFGTPALRGMLKETGLGSNPEVVRMFFRVGKAISEDSIVGSGGGRSATPGERSARTMYPNSNLN